MKRNHKLILSHCLIFDQSFNGKVKNEYGGCAIAMFDYRSVNQQRDEFPFGGQEGARNSGYPYHIPIYSILNGEPGSYGLSFLTTQFITNNQWCQKKKVHCRLSWRGIIWYNGLSWRYVTIKPDDSMNDLESTGNPEEWDCGGSPKMVIRSIKLVIYSDSSSFIWLVVTGCHELYFPRNIGFLIIPIDELHHF